MIERQLEPEVMDTATDAADYDAMDHREVNQRFVADFLTWLRGRRSSVESPAGELLDLGTGTALIPVELCRQDEHARMLAIDLAEPMLELARRHVQAAGLAGRIRLARCDAKALPYSDGEFAGAISNSIVHHIPEPSVALAEVVRVTAPGGAIFVRDLLRPDDEITVARLVAMYAAGANARQQQLFADSLRAALSLAEIRSVVGQLGFAAETVQQTSDRHWTWAAWRY